MIRVASRSEPVAGFSPLQGGPLDQIPVAAFGLMVLVALVVIMLIDSEWTWLSSAKTPGHGPAHNDRRSPGSRLGVVYCDADQFKPTNKTWGKAVGDKLRSTLAARIRGCVRESDAVGRIGKRNEIWVLLPGVHDMDDAVTVARKIRSCVTQPVRCDQTTIHPNFRIGATLALPGESLTEVAARVDAAKSLDTNFDPESVETH